MYEDRNYKDIKAGFTKTWRQELQRHKDKNCTDMEIEITKIWG